MSTVFYALGGGNGHLTRALNLQSRFAPCTILQQARPCAGTRYLGPTNPQLVSELLKGVEHLIVDCFPGGVGHELNRLPARSTLIARYVDRRAYPRYDELAARFDEILLPYDSYRCEWLDAPPGSFIGPVARTIGSSGETVDLLVIGSGEPTAWTPLLKGAVRIQTAFEVLPDAHRIVALQCGYNLFWELVDRGVPCAFRPLPRRFDDQFLRAGRFGVPLLHRDDLQRFLLQSAP